MDRDTRKQARKAVAATMHFVSSKIAKDGSPYWRMKGGDTPDGAADAASGVWDARIKELEAALAPFVAYYEKSMASRNPKMGDDIAIASIHNNFEGDTTITIGDLRRARAALSPDKEAE